MSVVSLGLVLLSAALHAIWNYVAKRTQGGAIFVWVLGVIENIIFLPLVLLTLREALPPVAWVFMFISAIIHVGYFLFLTAGYRAGDLSVVYPLARAIGPLLATIVAVLIFGERPSLIAAFGIFGILVGVIWLTGKPSDMLHHDARRSIGFALLTGVFIAGYTLWDKYAVSTILIAPLVFQWGNSFFRLLILTPYALRHRQEAATVFRRDWKPALIVAVLGFLSYWLILIALVTDPVSYVAPLRVISTLFGVLLGTRLLAEGQELRRLGAATLMIVGIIALAVG